MCLGCLRGEGTEYPAAVGCRRGRRQASRPVVGPECWYTHPFRGTLRERPFAPRARHSLRLLNTLSTMARGWGQVVAHTMLGRPGALRRATSACWGGLGLGRGVGVLSCAALHWSRGCRFSSGRLSGSRGGICCDTFLPGLSMCSLLGACLWGQGSESWG